MNIKEIGTRIKERQILLQLKQKDIIEKTGLSKAAISNYTNGNRLPETEALYKISIALNTSMEWLLTGKSTNEELNAEEQKLVNAYRIADTRGKRNIMRTALGEADQAADEEADQAADNPNQGKSYISKIG